MVEKNIKKCIYTHTHIYVCMYDRVSLLYNRNLHNIINYALKKNSRKMAVMAAGLGG